MDAGASTVDTATASTQYRPASLPPARVETPLGEGWRPADRGLNEGHSGNQRLYVGLLARGWGLHGRPGAASDFTAPSAFTDPPGSRSAGLPREVFVGEKSVACARVLDLHHECHGWGCTNSASLPQSFRESIFATCIMVFQSRDYVRPHSCLTQRSLGFSLWYARF